MINLQPTSSIILHYEEALKDVKLKAHPLQSGMRHICPLYTLFIQYSTGISSQSNKTGERNKRLYIYTIQGY
jgi:hypothetical protein